MGLVSCGVMSWVSKMTPSGSMYAQESGTETFFIQKARYSGRSNTNSIASFSAIASRNIIPVRICRSVAATSVTNSCDPSQTLIVGNFGCTLVGTEPIWLVGVGAAVVVTDRSQPASNHVPMASQPIVPEKFMGQECEELRLVSINC